LWGACDGLGASPGVIVGASKVAGPGRRLLAGPFWRKACVRLIFVGASALEGFLFGWRVIGLVLFVVGMIACGGSGPMSPTAPGSVDLSGTVRSSDGTRPIVPSLLRLDRGRARFEGALQRRVP
jgi:hypothetical protein